MVRTSTPFLLKFRPTPLLTAENSPVLPANFKNWFFSERSVHSIMINLKQLNTFYLKIHTVRFILTGNRPKIRNFAEIVMWLCGMMEVLNNKNFFPQKKPPKIGGFRSRMIW